VNIQFNGLVDEPSFRIQASESLNEDEIQLANKQLARVLGTDMDLRAFYEQAAEDEVIGPLLREYYGFKRISHATLFEDSVNRIVQMNLSHKPTARKMMYKVREKYANSVQHAGGVVAAWPSPEQLKMASPEQIRACGPTVRKGEYIIGMAEAISESKFDFEWLDEKADAETFYRTLIKIKGIGPSAAQQLMLTRSRTDAFYPSIASKGEEQGFRRWIQLAYGRPPVPMENDAFASLIANWKGFEAVAMEFMYINWIHEYKQQKNKS
jgi:3-methyladenine DNA glycosylase/8-oxoguanine DNA glycosylase